MRLARGMTLDDEINASYDLRDKFERRLSTIEGKVDVLMVLNVLAIIIAMMK